MTNNSDVQSDADHLKTAFVHPATHSTAFS